MVEVTMEDDASPTPTTITPDPDTDFPWLSPNTDTLSVPGQAEQGWADLPVILLEDIFSYLPMYDRYNCSLVCWNWNEVFDSPRIWRNFRMREGTFNYRRYNLFEYTTKAKSKPGYELYFSAKKCQGFLGRMAKHIRHLKVDAMENFHTLGEFFNILSTFLGFFMDYPMSSLESFHFTLACETRGLPGWDEPIVTGTGGNILNLIKSVISQIQDTYSLTLNQLLLQSIDANDLLSGYMQKNGETAQYIELINPTKQRYPIFQVAMFPNLLKLAISPHNINNDLVEMLIENTALEELVLVQDKYTPRLEELESINEYVWMEAKLLKPQLEVRLECSNYSKEQLLIQFNAPVSQIVTTSPYPLISHSHVMDVVENYRAHLTVFGHLGIPKKIGSRRFQERGDASYVLLARECPNLRTLVIRERVSTMTVLLVAREAKSLRNFFVRKNCVIIKCDWPRPDFWTEEQYIELVTACTCYDTTEKVVSKLLQLDWTFLSDKSFKQVTC